MDDSWGDSNTGRRQYDRCDKPPERLDAVAVKVQYAMSAEIERQALREGWRRLQGPADVAVGIHYAGI